MSDPERWRDGVDGAPPGAEDLLRRVRRSRRMTDADRARLARVARGDGASDAEPASTWMTRLADLWPRARFTGALAGALAVGPLAFTPAAGGWAVSRPSAPEAPATADEPVKTLPAPLDAPLVTDGEVRLGARAALDFAIVGDTRPAAQDDTAGYPRAVIDRIWQGIDASSPRPAFTIATGDYVCASAAGDEAARQLDLYLEARAAFRGPLFPALGNHECTGATDSNCGAENRDGLTSNYRAFLAAMITPLGLARPYYAVMVDGPARAWTAKFVFVAANAWDDAQAAWLERELAKPSTYTFVVRHEASDVTAAPGVLPSQAILERHPYTLLLAGHVHTFEHRAAQRELIVGTGGAPLSGRANYGYVIARRRDADGAIVFEAIDAATNAEMETFAVTATGAPAPLDHAPSLSF